MRPTLSSGSDAAPASRRPTVTPEPAIRTIVEISPTRLAGAAQASASSGTASPAWVGRAPCAAHPSASAHPAGTSRSATHVSTSAVGGSSPMAATTTAIDNGITSAHARVRNRSAHVGSPVAGTATQAACAETRTRLSTENHTGSSATRDALPAPGEATPQHAGGLSRSGNLGHVPVLDADPARRFAMPTDARARGPNALHANGSRSSSSRRVGSPRTRRVAARVRVRPWSGRAAACESRSSRG